MKVLKNAEAIFLVAAVCATFTAYATAETPVARTVSAAPTVAAASNNIPVVVVKAKRLTPAEKAALN